MRLHYLFVGFLLVIVDPMLACMPYRERFLFGIADIEPALEGTWYATWTRDGERHRLTFRLRVAGPPTTSATGLVRAADACGLRTLVRSAHACTTATFIPLELVPVDSAEGTYSALLYVGGYSFDGAVLTLTLGDPDTSVNAALSATGAVEELFAAGLEVPPTRGQARLEALWHVDPVRF